MRQFAFAGLLLTVLLCFGCQGSSESDCGGSCHDVPPATGAHLAHTGGLLPLSCGICHGDDAAHAEHPGHDDGSLTVLAQVDYESRFGSRPAWYGSVWGSAALFSGSDPSSSTCFGLVCHGSGDVGWTQDMRSAIYNRVCKNCHDITPSAFQLPGSGIDHRASDAAANYEGPISGFSRGGHGDESINDPRWFKDCAPGTSVPLACVACHDADSPHFPVAAENPYRMPPEALANTLPGAEDAVGPLTNLCTRTNCHPKVLGDSGYGFLSAIKHPSDHWPQGNPARVDLANASLLAPILMETPASGTEPAYDPAGRASPVGLAIDRYVDHWGYWDSADPATDDPLDDEPFMPLGDPLRKQAGAGYDNTPSGLLVCTTCHNPHGTDLIVVGQSPGVPSSATITPANKMLRLRDQDGELCLACH